MAWAYTNQPEPLPSRVTRGLWRVVGGMGPAWLVVIASVLLCALGTYAIDVAERLPAPTLATTGETAQAGPALGPAAKRQVAFVVAGLIAAVVVALPHYRRLGPWTWALFGAGLLLLVFLLVPGVPSSIVRPRGGARSWIDLGPMNLQPSELMKVACVLLLAWWLRYRKNHRTLKGLLPPALITGVPMALIILQPDLGTAILFVPMLLFVLVGAGAKLKHLALALSVAALCAPAAYPLLKPHQKARIAGLVMQLSDDTSEDLDINMQSVTSQRLIGAGGVAGVGDEHARALQRFNALPERHNDMVFSPIATRFGLLGALGTLALFALWIIGAFWTAATTREPFGRFLCVGAAGFLFAQVVVNVGMNVGLLPIIGITLPFVSNGGSSMVAQWVFVGLIVSVGLRRDVYALEQRFEDELD